MNKARQFRAEDAEQRVTSTTHLFHVSSFRDGRTALMAAMLGQDFNKSLSPGKTKAVLELHPHVQGSDGKAKLSIYTTS